MVVLPSGTGSIGQHEACCQQNQAVNQTDSDAAH